MDFSDCSACVSRARRSAGVDRTVLLGRQSISSPARMRDSVLHLTCGLHITAAAISPACTRGGVDYSGEPLLAGLALSHSSGWGNYAEPEARGGEVTGSLTGAWP